VAPRLALVQMHRLSQHLISFLIAHDEIRGARFERVLGGISLEQVQRTPKGFNFYGLRIRQLTSLVIWDQRVAIAGVELVSGHWTPSRVIRAKNVSGARMFPIYRDPDPSRIERREHERKIRSPGAWGRTRGIAGQSEG
jgi:hypothetical protein